MIGTIITIVVGICRELRFEGEPVITSELREGENSLSCCMLTPHIFSCRCLRGAKAGRVEVCGTEQIVNFASAS